MTETPVMCPGSETKFYNFDQHGFRYCRICGQRVQLYNNFLGIHDFIMSVEYNRIKWGRY